MPTEPVLAVLYGNEPRLTPITEPIARADDLGLARGDGAFETMHVRGGAAWLMDEHLARLANSLQRLGITQPSREALAKVITTAIDGWHKAHSEKGTAAPEAGVKLVCSRGPEFATESAPTTYAMVFPVSASFIKARRDGVRLAALNWGFPADLRSVAPWLLGGVKSLSYAANMAAIREAARRGCDDALLVSSDGYVLEGPTASVVWQQGDTLCSTPADTGILPSTTVAFLLKNTAGLGLASSYERITLASLSHVDGAWLCSSVRGAVPITAVVTDEGALELKQSPISEELRKLVAFSG